MLGSELRTTVINAAGPIASLALDSAYTIAVLTRISQVIEGVIGGTELIPPKNCWKFKRSSNIN